MRTFVRYGGYFGQKIPVMALLMSAYGLSPQRFVGASKWSKR